MMNISEFQQGYPKDGISYEKCIKILFSKSADSKRLDLGGEIVQNVRDFDVFSSVWVTGSISEVALAM